METIECSCGCNQKWTTEEWQNRNIDTKCLWCQHILNPSEDVYHFVGSTKEQRPLCLDCVPEVVEAFPYMEQYLK